MTKIITPPTVATIPNPVRNRPVPQRAKDVKNIGGKKNPKIKTYTPTAKITNATIVKQDGISKISNKSTADIERTTEPTDIQRGAEIKIRATIRIIFNKEELKSLSLFFFMEDFSCDSSHEFFQVVCRDSALV